MRKTFLTKGFVRFSRGLAGAALIAAAIGITSCETHSNSDRNESIKVYADPIAKEPIDAGIVGVKGGLAKLYVDANIDFVATWEDDAATPWAKVVDYSSTDPQTGLRVITLKANRRSTTSSYYTAHGHADSGSLRRRTELQPDNPHPPRLHGPREQ